MAPPNCIRENVMPNVVIPPPYSSPAPARQGYVVGIGNCPLYYQVWEPDSAPHALVLICPGIDDHSGRYPHLVHALMRAGYAVVAYDHRGNGRSGGPRLHVERFQHYVQDLDITRKTATELWENVPWFLFAHSMGTTVALSYLVQGLPAPRGLVASGTALMAGKGFSPLLLVLNRYLARVAPRLRLVGLPREGISRDPLWSDWGDVDPLVARKPGTTRLGTELLATLEELRSRLGQVTVPLLILHGTADKLTEVEGARLLYREAASSDKTLRLYEGAYHELVNDLADTRQAVLADLLGWLAERRSP